LWTSLHFCKKTNTEHPLISKEQPNTILPNITIATNDAKYPNEPTHFAAASLSRHDRARQWPAICRQNCTGMVGVCHQGL